MSDFPKDIFTEPANIDFNPLANLGQLRRETKPSKDLSCHAQVGFWLWEPATETVIHSLAIPRKLRSLLAKRRRMPRAS